MKERHIILRTRRLKTQFSGPLTAGPSALTADTAIETVVEVDEISSYAAPRLFHRYSDVIAVAPAMPVKLIQPLERLPDGGTGSDCSEWGIQSVRASTSPFGGSNVVVAILDTGIDANHPAFAGMNLIRKNFTAEADDDENGHGTHCAGTVFGRDVGGIRIGIARGVDRALVGKVIGANGGSSDQIVSAIQWAVDGGAHIISMSLGIDFPGYQSHLQDSGFPRELATSRALEAFRLNMRLFERLSSLVKARADFAQPSLIIAAAGNESRRDDNPDFKIAVCPPAVADDVISVAAVGRTAKGLQVAAFSNVGARVSAPGVDITSAAAGDGLRTLSGTSMAVPHVAGVAALWAEKLMTTRPLKAYEWQARLVGSATADELAEEFDSTDIGAGIVRAPQS